MFDLNLARSIGFKDLPGQSMIVTLSRGTLHHETSAISVNASGIEWPYSRVIGNVLYRC